MEYGAVTEGKFLRRPNRFVAVVEADGREEICHVKNTGRCRELLVPGAEVYLNEGNRPGRKTKYDLVAVKKGKLLVNMDSQAPNEAAWEWLTGGAPGGGLPEIFSAEREKTWRNSRFDLCAETSEGRMFIEVKGVTLERDGIALFPDAPTERGKKHVQEMTEWVRAGNPGLLLFVIQMRPVKAFCPNEETHPAFAAALREAAQAGVRIMAVDCEVTPETMKIGRQVPVIL